MNYLVGYGGSGIYADDITYFTTGHRTVEFQGKKRTIIPVIIRGTNGTIEEWSSNFDIGANHTDYFSKMGANYTNVSNSNLWRNAQNHKGFDVTATRVINQLNDYLSSITIPTGSERVIWIMGHSRAAGIANIVGTYYENQPDFVSFTYTFAAPNVTTDTNPGKYKTIYNLINENDFVTFVAPAEWGFTKYGQTARERINRNSALQKEWRDLTKQDVYNNLSVSALSNLVNSLANVVPTQGLSSYQIRESLYNFNLDKITTDRTILGDSNRMTRFSRHNSYRIAMYGTRIEIVDQTPSYFMQYIAYAAADDKRGGL